jgi:large repetitive protein
VTTVGPPGTVTPGVSAAVINAAGNIQVTWGTSDPNGAPSNSMTYSVGRFAAGASAPTTCQVPNPGSRGTVSSGWVDDQVGDGATYFYVVYADNGYYCTPTVSGQVQTKRTPGQASATVQTRDSGTGQYDIQIRQLDVQGPVPADVYQYRMNGGAWKAVVNDQWVTSMADATVYGNPTTVEVRGCRDASALFCGEPSAPTTVTPVNTRAGILSCQVGSVPVPSAPVNASVTGIRYLYEFNDGGITSLWTGNYTEDAVAPAPAPLGTGVTQVRVKAAVTIGTGPEYIDQGYGEGSCT